MKEQQELFRSAQAAKRLGIVSVDGGARNGISIADTVCMVKNGYLVVGTVRNFTETRVWIDLGEEEYEKTNTANVFVPKNLKEFTDFTVGSEVQYAPDFSAPKEHINCVVVGMNARELLLRQSTGVYISLPFDRVSNKN